MSKYEKIIRLANVWRLMHQRCYNQRTEHYARYGGRGITVAEEWFDRDTFIDWALSSGYEVGLELDRTDNDGPYSHDNCSWLTRKQQMQNTSRTMRVMAFGETKTLTEWAEDPRCEVPRAKLYDRIRNHGFSPEQAMKNERRKRIDAGIHGARRPRKYREVVG